MEQKPTEFMADKDAEVKELAQQVSLDLSTLEAGNVSINSSLHRRFIEAFLSLYLTTEPENEAELSEAEKKRLDYSNRVTLRRESANFVDRLQSIKELLRVRFEILCDENGEEQKKEEEEKKEEEQEYVDIFDGEGWARYAKTAKKELNRSEQTAAAINLGTNANTFIFDERVLHYLQAELEKLLDLQGGEKLKQYCENICNIRTKIKGDIAVFDSEIKWS